MALVDLELFKKHTRVDFDDDDDYLVYLLESAEERVIKDTNRTVEELSSMNGGNFPSSLKQAIMLLAAHWYNQREAVSSVQMAAVPYSLGYLINPWKKITRTETNDESGTYEEPAEDSEAGDEEEQLGE